MRKNFTDAIHKNRKGQAEYLLQNTFRIGIMVFALVAFFLLINFYVNSKIDTVELQQETFISRILYSDALSYQDPYIAKNYAGIIDLKKLNDKHLDQQINYGIFGRHAAARITILASDNATVSTAYLNGEQFKRWKVLIDARVGGRGSATLRTNTFPITYIDFNSQRHYGVLFLETIVSNS